MDEFRPYFDNAPVYGHGPCMEEFTAQTPLTVGSPQQVIDRYAGMRDLFGDYQRQLFLVDHAGLPLKTVLEQLDMLGARWCRCSAGSSPSAVPPTCPTPRPTPPASRPPREAAPCSRRHLTRHDDERMQERDR